MTVADTEGFRQFGATAADAWACEACGAVVMGEFIDTHREWHERIATIEETANTADMYAGWNRPIGG